MTAGVAVRRERGARRVVQVGPGAVQQLGRDDPVLLPPGEQDRHPVETAGVDRDPRVERQGAEQHRCTGPARRVGQEQPPGEGRATAEPDEQDRPVARGGVEPAPEPGHRVRQRLGDGPADAAVGEPREPAALGDRRPHGGVRQVLRQVVGQRRDLLLVGTPAVQQHDQRGVRVGRATARDDGLAERRRLAHEDASSTIRPAVRRPAQRRTSPARSRRSVVALSAIAPHSARGSIHITSNSLPSGSTP